MLTPDEISSIGNLIDRLRLESPWHETRIELAKRTNVERREASDVLERLLDFVKNDTDSGRFKVAIALCDNAETLYAAVMNNSPDVEAIRREFDAEIYRGLTDREWKEP